MSNKKAATASAKVPKVTQEAVLVLVQDVCTLAESGWRPLGDQRVQELKETFLAGYYGLNILKKPSLLYTDGSPKCGTDGNRLLCDGKHTIYALQEVKKMYDDESVRDTYEWSDALIKVFTDGVSVSIVEFPEDDPDLVVAYNVAAHDVDSNKYKCTSLLDLVAVANRYKERTPGGDWAKVQHTLEEVYGKGRRMFVYRMVSAAITVPDSVLRKWSEYKIPNSYLYENKYVMGQGADASKRLSEESRLKVLDVVHDDIINGKGVTAGTFQTEYCAPMKVAENWIKAKTKEYGKLIETPSWYRLIGFLQRSRDRLPILACMRASIRLEGVSDEQPGIEQCHIFIKELEILKTTSTGAGDSGMPAAGNGLVAATAAGTAVRGLDAAVSADVVMESGVDVAERDPASEARLCFAWLCIAIIQTNNNSHLIKSTTFVMYFLHFDFSSVVCHRGSGTEGRPCHEQVKLLRNRRRVASKHCGPSTANAKGVCDRGRAHEQSQDSAVLIRSTRKGPPGCNIWEGSTRGDSRNEVGFACSHHEQDPSSVSEPAAIYRSTNKRHSAKIETPAEFRAICSFLRFFRNRRENPEQHQCTRRAS